MGFNINSIIPMKRMNDLLEASLELQKLGYDRSAVRDACAELYEEAKSRLIPAEITEKPPFLNLTGQGLVMGEKGPERGESELFFETGYGFRLFIRGEENQRPFLKKFVQSLAMQLLVTSEKKSLCWRLIDAQNAGDSFGTLIPVVKSDREAFGGRVFSEETEISAALSGIEKRISNNINRMAGAEDSVFAYNRKFPKKIPILFLAVFDCDALSPSARKKLENIGKNAERGGICIVRVSFSEKEDRQEGEFGFELKDDGILVNAADVTALCRCRLEPITEDQLRAACERKKISTSAEDYIEIDPMGCRRDATEKLSVPFAVDEEGELVSLELGGSAPAHALISGTTGSGKSVLLHTLIDSIMLHYHPDDVEIWAIDYKAVEFACYVKERTPHISLIGQDKSEEFSYSLLKLTNREFERRKELFLSAGAADFIGYRKSGGRMSRLVIIVDEFHNLIQAISNEPGYRVLMENLLSEMRAMGMSFVFCSQFISGGLSGLTEKGRNQIGCRICMKQSSLEEIRDTLAENLSVSSEIYQKIVNFGIGQALYRKAGEQGYRHQQIKVLLISEPMRRKIIRAVMGQIGERYEHRHEIIRKNSEPYGIEENPYHSLNGYLRGENVKAGGEGLLLFPAAPTDLEDEFPIRLERETSANMIFCCENDTYRESLIFFTVASLLTDRRNRIAVTILDEKGKNGRRLAGLLRKLENPDLNIYEGGEAALIHIDELKGLRPLEEENRIEIFYGIQKLKSACYLLSRENETEAEAPKKNKREDSAYLDMEGKTAEEKMNAVEELLARLEREKSEGGDDGRNRRKEKSEISCDSEEKMRILSELFEYGPEIGYYSFLILDHAKQLKQAGIRSLEYFEHRVGGMMGAEDAYALFGSENFVKKADGKTLVYYAGTNKKVRTLRPYLLPEDSWINRYNRRREDESN